MCRPHYRHPRRHRHRRTSAALHCRQRNHRRSRRRAYCRRRLVQRYGAATRAEVAQLPSSSVLASAHRERMASGRVLSLGHCLDVFLYGTIKCYETLTFYGTLESVFHFANSSPARLQPSAFTDKPALFFGRPCINPSYRRQGRMRSWLLVTRADATRHCRASVWRREQASRECAVKRPFWYVEKSIPPVDMRKRGLFDF